MSNKIDFSKEIITKYIVEQLMTKDNASSEDALRQFMLTKTFDLLADNESMLWSESQEYVMDMMQSELSNDIDNWLKV